MPLKIVERGWRHLNPVVFVFQCGHCLRVDWNAWPVQVDKWDSPCGRCRGHSMEGNYSRVRWEPKSC